MYFGVFIICALARFVCLELLQTLVNTSMSMLTIEIISKTPPLTLFIISMMLTMARKFNGTHEISTETYLQTKGRSKKFHGMFNTFVAVFKIKTC